MIRFRTLLSAGLVLAAIAGAQAQTPPAPAANAEEHSAHHPADSTPVAPGQPPAAPGAAMGGGMMGGGMMGGTMMPEMMRMMVREEVARMGGGMSDGGMMRDMMPMMMRMMARMMVREEAARMGGGMPQSAMAQGAMGQGGMAGMRAGTMGGGVAGMGMPDMGSPAGPRSGMPVLRHIEGQIAFYRAELGITDAQSAAWNRFADALRTGAKGLQGAAQGLTQAGAQPALPDQMARRRQFLSAQLDAMQTVEPAATALYTVLSPEQKKLADEMMADHLRRM